ncbi:hypothetical protein EVAR_46722_1 [Eumeta japonica]|uniref:T-box domain-containing protein n=1 Tax=Eumeta variegata TaxID=151549 RepID=A0A4C1XDL4_EUMVA|nr:hypothetical protein EVAR_46722_1 [Eumeta japonica]
MPFLEHRAGACASEPPACEARLLNAELWRRFHDIGTEMIITKGGSPAASWQAAPHHVAASKEAAALSARTPMPYRFVGAFVNFVKCRPLRIFVPAGAGRVVLYRDDGDSGAGAGRGAAAVAPAPSAPRTIRPHHRDRDRCIVRSQSAGRRF